LGEQTTVPSNAGGVPETGIFDNLPGQGEQLIPAGQQPDGLGIPAQLSGRLIDAHLVQG